MALQTTPYTVPILACGVGYAAFAAYLARHRDRYTGASRFAAPLLFGIAVWLLAYAAELSTTTKSLQLLFARVQYVGPATVPVLWFAYVLSYTGHEDALSRRAWMLLATPPVVVFALVATYPATDLVWTNARTVDTGTWTALVTDHGPGFYAYMTYVYALFAATVWLLVQNLATSGGVYRRQTIALLAGGLVPGVVGLLYISNVDIAPHLNLPALALVVTAGTVAWSVTRDDLFTLEPIAWKTAIQQLDDAVFIVDNDDRVVAANATGESLADADVGAPASDALGGFLDEPSWREPGDHTTDAYRDGGHRVFETSVSPIERDHAQLGLVVVVRDVTEQHRREERLEEFASVVSHDLRNPLNVASGHLELALETGDENHLEEADDALDRMEAIIDDLLTLAREGEPTLDTEPVSLADAARTAWGTVDELGANATLDVRDDRTLTADETALLRLLENLFRNAVEHGSTSPDSQTRQDAVEHGSTSPDSQTRQDAFEHDNAGVTVTVGATEDGFFVADDGPGIPEDDRDTVFEYGYTTSENGTGFGLAIVQEVARDHGWTVDLTESESGGARFDVTVE